MVEFKAKWGKLSWNYTTELNTPCWTITEPDTTGLNKQNTIILTQSKAMCIYILIRHGPSPLTSLKRWLGVRAPRAKPVRVGWQVEIMGVGNNWRSGGSVRLTARGGVRVVGRGWGGEWLGRWVGLRKFNLLFSVFNSRFRHHAE